MMRSGDKLASYRALAEALAHLKDLPWRLLVAGDGAARAEVAAALEACAPGRSLLLGALGMAEIAALDGAADLFAWPAVNEAYGMAMLEAQAAGLPVVSCATRGVPDVVVDGQTGLLAPPGDPVAFAARLRALLEDPALRARQAQASAAYVTRERSLAAASADLARRLASLRAPRGAA